MGVNVEKVAEEKILCVVMTSPEGLDQRAQGIYDTWGTQFACAA